MELDDLVRLNRVIRVIGFDDAPFSRHASAKVFVAGVVCAGTRFEGMVWAEVERDGWDATDRIVQLLVGRKFLPQPERRLYLLQRAGTIHTYPPFFFQVCGANPQVIASVLLRR